MYVLMVSYYVQGRGRGDILHLPTPLGHILRVSYTVQGEGGREYPPSPNPSQGVRAHDCKNDHAHIRPFACRSDSSGLWPGCLLGVWVANLPWMPVASNQMPSVIAVNLGLRTDTTSIKMQPFLAGTV